MPGREFIATLVRALLLGNGVVANVALRCWKSENAAFPKRLKMTIPSNCCSEPNVLFGPAA
jgi:hypothetical protein